MRTITLARLVVLALGILLISPSQAQITVGNPVTVAGTTVGASGPEGIAYHPLTNTLFVLDSNTRLIQIDLSGKLISSRQLGLSEAEGITYDPVTGDLLVAGASTVHQFRTDGTLVSTLLDLTGLTGDASGIAIHPLSGNLWIVDDNVGRVYEVDRTGAVQSSLNTSTISSGFTEPQGIVFWGLDLLVVDDGHSTQTLYLISTSGELLQTVAKTNNFGLFDPEGVTVALGSAIWVVGDDDAKLIRLDITGGSSPSGAARLYFAQFGNGSIDGITLISDIVLPNPSSTKIASGTVTFFAGNGSPFVTDVVEEGTTSLVPFEIPPLDSTTISTTGQGDFGTGTAVVSSDVPLGGVIRFAISAPPGVGSGIAGVPASQVVSGFVTPVRRVADGINTGVAIRNVGSGEVNLNLSLRGENGVEVPSGSAARSITGDGQLVDFINGLFPDADTSNFVGSVVITSDGMIAATAIEQGVNPGEFTTLPVTPLE